MLKLLVALSIILPTCTWGSTSDLLPQNRKYVYPTHFENCNVPGSYPAPSQLVDGTGRLIEPLRIAAANTAVIDDLVMAIKLHLQGNTELSNAYTDITVTGEKAYDSFVRLHQNAQSRNQTLLFRLKNDAELSEYSEQQLQQAMELILDRAYLVAQVIYSGQHPLRSSLGWLAVSAEDDSPITPINTDSTRYPQHHLNVQVGTHNIKTRFVVAQTGVGAPLVPFYSNRDLPTQNPVQLAADAKVLLYIPTQGATIEEAADLISAFEQISHQRGENWTVIAIDLPGSGYSSKPDHLSISSLDKLGYLTKLGFNSRGKQNTPVLDFLESFIIEFVETLDKEISVKNRIQAVLGGDLGGSLALRLGRNKQVDWAHSIVSWSASSTWRGFTDGNNPLLEKVLATAWKRAGGDANYLQEDVNQREKFFKEAYEKGQHLGPLRLLRPATDYWYRSNWSCASDAIEYIKQQRQEIYHSSFRTWHWRLNAEQLLYSHRWPVNTKEPRYYQNTTRSLLLCGMLDNFAYSRICGNIQTMSQYMKFTPGQAQFLYNTGHSIHQERPNHLAQAIVDFLQNRGE